MASTPNTEHPWLKHYPEGLEWDQSFDIKPIQEFLDESVQAFGKSDHLYFYGKSWTYAETGAIVNKVAKGLQALGVGPGVKVGMFLPNTPYSIFCFYGILKAGGTVVNYSPLYCTPELIHQIDDSDTDFLFTNDMPMFMDKMADVLSGSRLKKVIVCSFSDCLPSLKKWMFRLLARSKISSIPNSDDYMDYNSLINNIGDYKSYPVDLDDIAVLQYTGGTTGVPKGAMLTHRCLSSNIEQSIAWDPDLTETARGSVLAVLPFFHVFGMTIINCLSTALGGRLVILPKLDADEVLRTIKRTEINLLAFVPTMYTALLKAKRFKDTDLSKVTGSLSGGAPLPNDLKISFEKYLPNGLRIQEGYGLTETSPAAIGNLKFGLQKLGSIGLPIPGTEIYFSDIDDPHKILPYGEIGEICLKGPQIMAGYWKKPEATAEVMINGGFRTGDIGYMDDDGYTFIVDRKKDMILVGGFNVYPRIIEEVLYKHDDIVEAIVIGVPDDYLGEIPKAFVVLVEGRSLSETDILTYLKKQIGKHEMPKYIEFRNELPKTPIGKLSKKDLIEEERLKGLA